MGLWPKRTEVSERPAKLAVSASLESGDYDWLHDEALRTGLSMSRLVADLIHDYRVTLASVNAAKSRATILTDADELAAFDERISEEEWLGEEL